MFYIILLFLFFAFFFFFFVFCFLFVTFSFTKDRKKEEKRKKGTKKIKKVESRIKLSIWKYKTHIEWCHSYLGYPSREKKKLKA